MYAQDFVLPKPGTMVSLSPAAKPTVLRAITVHPENPFLFDFIVEPQKGSAKDQAQTLALKVESEKLIRYFLASLAMPEEDLWVNLSPYEKDRIIPESFGKTEMGRDLLAQDYLLKQITASLIYPEGETGKAFWEKIYAKAQALYGRTDIPVNTFNKVWIMPDIAKVYEKGQTCFIVKSSLKVMLESDYLSQKKNTFASSPNVLVGDPDRAWQKQVIREVIIPVLEKEINEGANFAPLRQVYNSLVLATWFKQKMKQGLLGQKYINQRKVKGVDLIQGKDNQEIYEQYLMAFKKGAYNYIKEEVDPLTQEIIPRKYFSGGYAGAPSLAMATPDEATQARSLMEDGAMTARVALQNEKGTDQAVRVAARPKDPRINAIKQQLSHISVEEILLRKKARLSLLSLKERLKNGMGLSEIKEFLLGGFVTADNILVISPEIERLMFQDKETSKNIMDLFEVMNKKGISWRLSSDVVDRLKEGARFGYNTGNLEDLTMLRVLMGGDWFKEEDRKEIEEILVSKKVFIEEWFNDGPRSDQLLGVSILEEFMLIGILDQGEINSWLPKILKLVLNNTYSGDLDDLKWQYGDPQRDNLRRKAIVVLEAIAERNYKWQINDEEFAKVEALIKGNYNIDNQEAGIDLLSIIIRAGWLGNREFSKELLKNISSILVEGGMREKAAGVSVLLREQGYSSVVTDGFKKGLERYGILYVNGASSINEKVFRSLDAIHFIGGLKYLLSSLMLTETDLDILFEQVSKLLLSKDEELQHKARVFMAHIPYDVKKGKRNFSKRAIKAYVTAALTKGFFDDHSNREFLMKLIQDGFLGEDDIKIMQGLFLEKSVIPKMTDAEIIRLIDIFKYTGDIDSPESYERFVRAMDAWAGELAESNIIDGLRLAVRMKKISREEGVKLLYKVFMPSDDQTKAYRELTASNDNQYKELISNLDVFIENGFQLRIFDKQELLKFVSLFEKKAVDDEANAQRWIKLINQISVQSIDDEVYQAAYDSLVWLANQGFAYAEQLLEGQVRSMVDRLKPNGQRGLTVKERVLINAIQNSRRQASLMPLLTDARINIEDRFLILKVLAQKNYIDPEYINLDRESAPQVFKWVDQIYQEFEVVPSYGFLDECRSSGGGCIEKIKAVKPKLEEIVKTKDYRGLIRALSDYEDMMLAYYLLYPSLWKYQGVAPMTYKRFKDSILEVGQLLSAQVDIKQDLVGAYQKAGLTQEKAQEIVDLLMKGDMPIKKDDPIRQKLDGKGIWIGKDEQESNSLRKKQARESFDDLRHNFSRLIERQEQLKGNERWFKSKDGKWLWEMDLEETDVHLGVMLDVVKKGEALPSLIGRLAKELDMSKLLDVLWRQMLLDADLDEVDQLVDLVGHIHMAWENYHIASSWLNNQKIYVKPIYKFDLMQFLRFADGGHCCLTSDPKIGGQFGNAWQHVLEYMADAPHFFWQVVTEDGQQVGWYENWMGIDQETGKPMVGTELLYLAPAYQQGHIQEGVLSAVREVLLNQGIEWIGQLVPVIRPSNALIPPISFVHKGSEIKKLQSVMTGGYIYEDRIIPTNQKTVQPFSVDPKKVQVIDHQDHASRAMAAQLVTRNLGGIDFNPNNIKLDVARDSAMTGSLIQALPTGRHDSGDDIHDWSNIEISSLSPFIIEMKPANLQALLN